MRYRYRFLLTGYATMPALALLTLNLLVLQDPQHLEFVPMETGVTIVQGVSGDAYQGRDYEAVITIESAGRNLTLGSMAFVKDRAGVRRWLSVRRTVLAEDLRAARTMILGFDTDDAERLPGTTAMGPSRGLLDELRRNARLGTVVRNYAGTPDNSGTLELVDRRPVAFPLLVNGLRVSVPAVHARGQLRGRGGARPWEFWFLDHPLQPLTLKVMYGAEGESTVGRPEWSRQITRIDVPRDLADVAGGNVKVGEAAGEAAGHGRAFPAGTGAVLAAEGGPLGADGKAPTGAGALPGSLEASAGGEAGSSDGAAAGAGAAGRPGGGAPIGGAGDQARMGAGAAGAGLGMGAGLGAGAGMERRLVTQCRVSVPGIYFEFDSDVLNPASKPWIRSIADLLRRHPDWTITIEGHTDSVGSRRYNLDLSTRRAASLARSLTSQHGIAAARLTTRGFGPDRPLESNAKTEGRARNRRVELVRPCDRPTR